MSVLQHPVGITASTLSVLNEFHIFLPMLTVYTTTSSFLVPSALDEGLRVPATKLVA